MTVRNAVAKREEAAEQAAKPPSIAQVVRQAIDTQSSAFRTVLPRHVDPDRFGRLVLTAIKSTPELMQCFATDQGRTSVLISAMQAATIGLEPNTAAEEAWLTPRPMKGVWECQLSIGYKGYLKLARSSGKVKTVYGEVVHEHDHFRWERGLEADVLEHRPAEGNRGQLVYAYAVVRYMNGGYDFVVLNRAQVEARRAMSPTWRSEKGKARSPWTTNEAAMWRKSAIRALRHGFDLSPHVEEVLRTDEKPLHFDDEAGIIEVASAFGQLEPGDEDAAPTVDAEGVIEATADEGGELPLEGE